MFDDVVLSVLQKTELPHILTFSYFPYDATQVDCFGQEYRHTCQMCPATGDTEHRVTGLASFFSLNTTKVFPLCNKHETCEVSLEVLALYACLSPCGQHDTPHGVSLQSCLVTPGAH